MTRRFMSTHDHAGFAPPRTLALGGYASGGCARWRPTDGKAAADRPSGAAAQMAFCAKVADESAPRQLVHTFSRDSRDIHCRHAEAEQIFLLQRQQLTWIAPIGAADPLVLDPNY